MLTIESYGLKLKTENRKLGNIMTEDKQIIEDEGLWDGRLVVFESLPSTNQWAMQNLDSCRHGDIVCATRQTAGKGRFSRSWMAPDDRGLTLSVVLMPGEGQEVTPAVGQTAALAIRAILEAFGIDAVVKWPNDVLVGSRKIAGILMEGDSATGTVLLGIGLNVNVTEGDFETIELIQPATSMAIEKGQEFDISEVRRRLLAELKLALDAAEAEGPRAIMDNWKEYDCLMGKRIEVQTATNMISGIYTDLDEEGKLCLVDDTGKEHTLWSGDVKAVRS